MSTIDGDPLTIQTMATHHLWRQNPNFSDFADTENWIYDSGGGLWEYHNYIIYDTLKTMMPADPGTYYIRVTEFRGDALLGENGLNLTGGAPWDNTNEILYGDGVHAIPIAPGEFANPLGKGNVGGVKGAGPDKRGSAGCGLQHDILRTFQRGRRRWRHRRGCWPLVQIRDSMNQVAHF